MRKELTLDHAYHWEKDTPDALWLTQPTGGGEVVTFTWAEAMDQARRMASYLKSLDLPDKSQIALFSKNSAWWILTDLAIWMAGHVTVPLYPTLTSETISYILEHSDSKLIFVGKLDKFEEMAPGIPEGLPRVVMPLAPDSATGEQWDDLLEANEPLEGETVRDPDEMATIVYTSGSTGKPKGVMLSFDAIARSAVGVVGVYDIGPEDRMLSYLPLAHVFERWIVENASFVSGMQLFFAESLETFVADLRRAEPTVFISVPRLWQKFQQGVFHKMPPARLAFMLKVPLLKQVIRRRVLEGLGLDQVRVAGTGSAPIPAELIEWYRSLGLELYEGWAMSENFAYGTANRPGKNKVGTIGTPYPGVEVRISEQGEIQCKSPGMMMGYFKNEEATKGTFTDDGWLKTGDRGTMDDDGFVRITGRVKEIFKTSKGKYVAPAHIESKLLLHEDVEMACVMGSGQPQPCAVVMLSEAGREKLSGERDVIVDSIAKHIEDVNAELPGYERLQVVAVSPNEWTIEDGLLTPTMKVRRAQMEDRYGPMQDGWYEQKSKVLVAEA